MATGAPFHLPPALESSMIYMPTFEVNWRPTRRKPALVRGRFLIRAKFMDNNGASLGYSDITAMYPGAITSWTRVGGRVTAPANSVSMQVQYLLYQSSG